MEKDNLYIITVKDSLVRKNLKEQLKELEISTSKIIIYHTVRDYDFWSKLDPKYYEEELKQLY